MIVLICVLILGVASIHLWNTYPIMWFVLVSASIFYFLAFKQSVWVPRRRGPRSIKEIQAKDLVPPKSIILAVRERWALKKEFKTKSLELWRKREIAKRIVFIDGYLAGKK